MADLITLHSTRQAIDKKRQPSHSAKLDEFNLAISSKKIFSPYDVRETGRFDFYGILNTFPEFNQGSQGKIVNTTSDYIYRIVNIYDIASQFKSYWKLDNELNPADFNEKSIFCSRFIELEEIKNASDWIPLRRCIRTYDFDEDEPVYYSNKRRFSFWTDSPLFESDILKNTFKVGLPSDWIVDYSIILRCKVKNLNSDLIRIPTVLDAFDQPIFLSMWENCSVIGNGIAINIEPTPLETGFKEYVIGLIETEEIDFLPVLVDDLNDLGIALKDNLILISKLEDYYSSLQR